jgi:hypothetical protein
MWKKKCKKQIKEDQIKKENIQKTNRFKKAINAGMWGFIITFFLRLIFSITVGIDYSSHTPGPTNRINIHEIPDYFPNYLITALIVSFALFLFRFISPSLFQEQTATLMCDKCFTTKNYDKNKLCDCGGIFDSIDNFEWIEEEEGINFLVPNMNWINDYRINKNEG